MNNRKRLMAVAILAMAGAASMPAMAQPAMPGMPGMPGGGVMPSVGDPGAGTPGDAPAIRDMPAEAGPRGGAAEMPDRISGNPHGGMPGMGAEMAEMQMRIAHQLAVEAMRQRAIGARMAYARIMHTMVAHIRAMDRNDDGQVTEREFVTGMMQLFDRLDGNGDGVLDREDMRRLESHFAGDEHGDGYGGPGFHGEGNFHGPGGPNFGGPDNRQYFDAQPDRNGVPNLNAPNGPNGGPGGGNNFGPGPNQRR